MPRTTRATAKAADPVAESEDIIVTPTVEDDAKGELQGTQELTAPAKKSKGKKKGSKKKRNKANIASAGPEVVAEEDGDDEVDKEEDNAADGTEPAVDAVKMESSGPDMPDDKPVELKGDVKDQVQMEADAAEETHLDSDAKVAVDQVESVDAIQSTSINRDVMTQAESFEEPSGEKASAQAVQEVPEPETEPGQLEPERTGTELESTERLPTGSILIAKIVAEPTEAAPSLATGPEPQDPITELDALEDALEEANKALPIVEDPLRSPVKESAQTTKPSKTIAQVSSTSKLKTTTEARRSVAAQSTLQRSGSIMKPEARKPANFARSTASRPSMAASKPAASKLSQSTTTRPIPSSAIGNKDGPTEKPVDYLAAKRRPISMQFPTPPPPSKSSKPTTKPSFTLPGDAIAAKLKAAREERLKREAGDDKKNKQFHARPVPSTTKSVAPAVAIKQTAASKARMSIAGGSDKENAPSTDKHARKPSTATNTIKKRASVIGAPRPTAVVSKRASMMGPSTAPVPTKPRITSLASSVSSIVPAKGKEVFGRDKIEKDSKDKEKREKEDKTKKAREEAAERSRQLSREFRERQKRKAEMEKVKKTEAGPALVEA